MKLERIKWIDTTKGMCIFLVVFGHCITREGVGKVFFLNRLIYSFHVPLFFLISGINLKLNGSLVDFVKKRIIRVVLPAYLFVALYNICIVLINGINIHRGGYREFLKLIFCFRDSMIANWWFLPALFTAQIILFFINKLYNNFLKIVVLGMCLSLYIINYFNDNIAFPFCLEISALALLFLAVGFYGKELLHRVHSHKGFVLALLIWVTSIVISVKCGYGAMNMWGCNIYNLPLFIFGGLSGSYIVIYLSKKVEKITMIGKLGKETLWIYGIHYIFLDIFCEIVEMYIENSDFIQNLLIVFTGSVIIITCSYFVAFLKRKIIRKALICFKTILWQTG